jgi:signal transduction histidine kinase
MENEAGLKWFFWIGTAIMLFSVLGTILTVVLYRNKIHKINRKESESLLKSSLESEKKERRRIASDFHDSISGDLSAVQNYITILSQKEKDSFNKSVLQEVETALANVIENVQDISYNLMPPTLESLGLASTLRTYFERVQKWSNINIKEEYHSECENISPSDAYEIYRIVQELVTNVIKHSNCKQIKFIVYENEMDYVFEIIDDGVSFDFYSNVKAPYGMGLKNISSRLKYLNAKLIQLPIERGNQIQIYLNIKANVTNSNN